MATKFGTGANDSLKGGAEDDTLVGLGGDDWLWGEGGDDILLGGSGNDRLIGDSGEAAGDDILHGEDGHDHLWGFGGDDELHGGAGHDRLDGGDGADLLVGGAGNDRIQGGAGDDTVVGLEGSDRIDGGAGFDTLDLSGITASGALGFYVNTAMADGTFYNYSTAERGSINGIEKILGTSANDLFFAGASDDWFDGGAGDDWFDGGAGGDYVWGGTGIDTASYASASSGVTAALQSFNSNGTGDAKDDVILQVERLLGSSFDDTLTGDRQNNEIRGGAGDDVIDGATGSDTMNGGRGADTFVFAETFSVTHGRTTVYTDYGDDVIQDYEAGVDTIRLEGYRSWEVSVTTSGSDAIVHAGAYVDVRVEDAAGLLDVDDILFA